MSSTSFVCVVTCVFSSIFCIDGEREKGKGKRPEGKDRRVESGGWEGQEEGQKCREK